MPSASNIKLGHGYKSVSAEGGACVVNSERSPDIVSPEQKFKFIADFYDSKEELEQDFKASISLTGGVSGADLALGASTNTELNTSDSNAFYMMTIEYLQSQHELRLNQEPGANLLDTSVKDDLAQLKTLEQWQEFYRKNGDLVINSVTYGEKFIIIVSLKHKIQNEHVRQALETKLSIPSQAALTAEIEKQIKKLTDDSVASVQIYSIGNARPNFLAEIATLAKLKQSITSFVNGSSSAESSDSQSSEKTTAAENDLQSNTSAQYESSQTATVSKAGAIIKFTTCSYIDLINKPGDDFKNSYNQMLKCTSSARHCLQAIYESSQRLRLLNSNISIYLKRKFVTSHAFEEQAHELQTYFKDRANFLEGCIQEVKDYVSGFGETASARRKSLLKANQEFDLINNFTTSVSKKSISDIQALIDEYIKTFNLISEDQQHPLNLNRIFPVENISRVKRLEQQFEELDNLIQDHLGYILQSCTQIKNEVTTVLTQNSQIIITAQQLLRYLNTLAMEMESQSIETSKANSEKRVAWKNCITLIGKLSALTKNTSCPASWKAQVENLAEIAAVSTSQEVEIALPSQFAIQEKIQTLSDLIEVIIFLQRNYIVNESVPELEVLANPAELNTLHSTIQQISIGIQKDIEPKDEDPLSQLNLTIDKFNQDYIKKQHEIAECLSKIKLSAKNAREFEENHKKRIRDIETKYSNTVWREGMWDKIYLFSKELDKFLETSPIDKTINDIELEKTLAHFYSKKDLCDKLMMHLETICSTHTPSVIFTKQLKETQVALDKLLMNIPIYWLTKSSYTNRLLEKYHLFKELCEKTSREIEASHPTTPSGQDLQIKPLKDFLSEIKKIRESNDDTRPATCCGVDFRYSAFLTAIVPLGTLFSENRSNFFSPLIPTETRFLRITYCSAEFLPEELKFTIRRKEKIRTDDRADKHSGLHKMQTRERAPAVHLQGEKLRQYVSKQSIDKIDIMGSDINTVYKDIYFDNVIGIPAGKRVVMLVYAQVGPTITPLGFKAKPPRPQPNYGSRVKSVEEVDTYQPHRLMSMRNSSPLARRQPVVYSQPDAPAAHNQLNSSILQTPQAFFKTTRQIPKPNIPIANNV